MIKFQDRVQPWMMECFGPVISIDVVERNHRFLEEAIELVQAGGCSREEAHQLVDYTFNRPVGELGQEVGGVMVTLAALCLAWKVDMYDQGWIELSRIMHPEMVAKIRAKQAAKPKFGPLPEHVTLASEFPLLEEVPFRADKAWFEKVVVVDSRYKPTTPSATMHQLKIWPEHFVPLIEGLKTCEVRRNDRGFKVNDILSLNEWSPATEKFTGRGVMRTISHVLDMPSMLEPEYVVLSLSTPNAWELAVQEMMIINHLDWSDCDTPADAIRRLVNWENSVALDPAVSEAARELMERGAAGVDPMTSIDIGTPVSQVVANDMAAIAAVAEASVHTRNKALDEAAAALLGMKTL